MTKEEVISVLTENGLKVTPQRMGVLHAVRNSSQHPTADQIYDLVKLDYPGITQATVYNILEIFTENNLVHKVFTPEGKQRFDPLSTHHGHIYCNNTKEIVDFYDVELNQLITDFFRKKKISNFKIKNISLLITGDKLDENKEVNIK